jgi:hypothetical protein
VNDLRDALVSLMRELTDMPCDPQEAFASWEQCVEALHNAGEHNLCDHT